MLVPKNSIVTKSYYITSDDFITIADSTFFGFRYSGADSHGSCIACAYDPAVLTITRSLFMGNYADSWGGAVGIEHCSKATMTSLCFSRNYAESDADLYMCNRYLTIKAYSISRISMYLSSSVKHGFCVGSNEKSSLSNINQSSCTYTGTTHGSWVFYHSHSPLVLDYSFSGCNTHVAVFSSSSTDYKVTINHFCSANDTSSQIFNVGDNTAFLLENSVFIFDSPASLGTVQIVDFHECYSNIAISPISFKRDVTVLPFVAEECWKYNISRSDSKESVVMLLSFSIQAFPIGECFPNQ